MPTITFVQFNFSAQFMPDVSAETFGKQHRNGIVKEMREWHRNYYWLANRILQAFIFITPICFESKQVKTDCAVIIIDINYCQRPDIKQAIQIYFRRFETHRMFVYSDRFNYNLCVQKNFVIHYYKYEQL